MINKVLIGILALLVILTGGVCTYSYMLNEQIDALGKQLALFEEKQEARITPASNELTTLREETVSRIGILEDDMFQTKTKIGVLEDDTVGIKTRIDMLDSEVKSIATEFGQSFVAANKVYETASQATVRVSDGERTVGSGFVFDANAHVLTAHHVVENLSEIYVVLPDGRISRATVTGSCQYSDIAVLALEDEPDIVPPAMADSASMKIGEQVVVIGCPFNLTQTLTSGIVSQINRFVEIEYDSGTRWVASLIQFDAAVNFGNSGSPLLNYNGEVVGMVIGRIKPDMGDGIYYAVSSNKVKRVATSLIDLGSFDYPWLGVEVANITPQIVEVRGLETTHGALVRNVFTEGPAEAAGIMVDDVIVAIDGMRVTNVGDLTSYLGEYKRPDDIAMVTLTRDSATLELSLKIGKRG